MTIPPKLKHVRHGIGALRPYLYGHPDSLAILEDAFGAEIVERLPVGKAGFHIEARVGDAMVVLEMSDDLPAGATQASVYVYVENVDDAYLRALRAGATSVAAPEDKPYGERGAGVRDRFGNTWWIATYTG